MHWIDLLIVGVIAWFTFRAFRNGLIREVVTVAALIIGAVLAGAFYDELSANLDFLIEAETQRNLVAFIAIFAGTLLVGLVIAGVLSGMAAMLLLGPLDHIGGAFVGFLKGVLLVEVLLIAFSVFPAWEGAAAAVDESALAPFFLDAVPVIELVLPDRFEDSLDQLEEWRALLPGNVPGF